MSWRKVPAQSFVLKAPSQCYQSPDRSTAAIPDIYLIYSLPKLQSKSHLLKSAVCCAALTNRTGGCASAEGEGGGGKRKQRKKQKADCQIKRERERERPTGAQIDTQEGKARQIESTQGREGRREEKKQMSG